MVRQLPLMRPPSGRPWRGARPRRRRRAGRTPGTQQCPWRAAARKVRVFLEVCLRTAQHSRAGCAPAAGWSRQQPCLPLGLLAAECLGLVLHIAPSLAGHRALERCFLTPSPAHPPTPTNTLPKHSAPSPVHMATPSCPGTEAEAETEVETVMDEDEEPPPELVEADIDPEVRSACCAALRVDCSAPTVPSCPTCAATPVPAPCVRRCMPHARCATPSQLHSYPPTHCTHADHPSTTTHI